MKYKDAIVHAISGILFLSGLPLFRHDSLLAVSLISCSLFVIVAVSVKRAEKRKKKFEYDIEE